MSRLIEKAAALPSFVALPFTLRNGPAPSPGQHAGFLGTAYDPFLVLRDPNADEFKLDELENPADMNSERASRRVRLLERFGAGIRRLEETAAVEGVGAT